MKIVIRDRNALFIKAMNDCLLNFAAAVADFDIVTECGDIFENWDYYARPIGIVSPANSFGFMNGGIDAVYIQKFGQDLENEVRKTIRDKTTHNELLVGQSLVVQISGETIYDKNSEFLIVAPTMRVPQRIVDRTDVYLATRSAIKNACHHRLSTVLMPGMGIGVGNVPYELGARNMLMGIVDAMNPSKQYGSCAESFLDAQKFNW